MDHRNTIRSDQQRLIGTLKIQRFEAFFHQKLDRVDQTSRPQKSQYCPIKQNASIRSIQNI